MGFPAGAQTTLLTMTIGQTDGSARQERITITPSPPQIVSTALDDIREGSSAPVAITTEWGTGAASVRLLNTDADGYEPSGWTYTVQRGSQAPYSISLPASLGATADLADLTPVPAAPGTYDYLIVTTGTPDVGQVPVATSGTTAEWGDLHSAGLDTGVIQGCLLRPSATPLSVDLSAGFGQVVDYVTDPGNPSVVRVDVVDQTVAISNTVEALTWYMVDVAGLVIQQVTVPTNAQRRTHIQLGATVVVGGDVVVVNSIPTIIPQPVNQMYDLMDAIGAFNVTGNEFYAAGADLTMAKNGGTVFNRGFNYFTGSGLTDDPHVSTVESQNPMSFRYLTRTAPSEVTTTLADPNHYDVGGAITEIFGDTSQSTVQRLYLFPINDLDNQVVIQYGQTIYGSLDLAVSSIGTDPFEPNPNLGNGVFMGYLVMAMKATDLSDPSTARLFMASKFGGSFAASNAALALSLLLTGGTMTGPLILDGDPSAALQAAPKQYVDATQAAAVLPSDQGLKSWSFDPAIPTNSSALPAGVVQLVRLQVRAATTISSVLYGVASAATSATSGQCFVGLYTSAGALLSGSADQASAWGSTGLKTTALTTPQAVAPGWYWVAFLFNGATGPAIYRQQGGLLAMANAGLTSSTARFGSYGTAQTALPSPITPSSVSLTGGITYWCAVS